MELWARRAGKDWAKRHVAVALLFGNGAVEDTLDGRPGVSDGEWRVVGTFQEVADELFGVASRAAGGLQDERDKVDVWISVEFDHLMAM